MFVDDITISSKSDFKEIVPEIINIIRVSGFKINNKKTHYKTKNPIITGLVCQNNRLLVPNSLKKKLAKMKKEQLDNQKVDNRINGLENYIRSVKNLK